MGAIVQITPFGAAGMVTGSCFLVEAGGGRFLVDCGLFQGSDEDEALNREPWPFVPADLDAVVLTHAHLDHSGRLPLLYRGGFRGHVFATAATKHLARLMLLDSAHLMAEQASYERRRARRSGREAVPPLYDVDDVMDTIELFRVVDTDRGSFEVNPGVRVDFHRAGHVLGSVFVEIVERAPGGERKAIVSGDLGNAGREVMPDPDPPPPTDVLFVESTYGDRDHRSMEATRAEFAEAVVSTLEGGGNVLIPAFALERAQDILFELGALDRAGQLPRCNVFLDSPLAISITEVFRRHHEELEGDLSRMLRAGQDPFGIRGLVESRTPDQSRAINAKDRGSIIIAGSGMATGGRIIHHLKHNLWRGECSVIFTGFQANGTLGRRLVNREPFVRIYGEEVAVRAQVFTINGFSAHAGQSQLVEWAGRARAREVVTYHGEPEAQDALASAVRASGAAEKIARARFGAAVAV
jgi:metallo-beta-lactamase family protein